MSENLNNDQIISADFEVSTELNVQLGSVYQGSSVDSLSELSDVAIDISTLANGNSLIYDSISGKWINGEVAPGADDLSELGDVNITTPSNDQILRYNSTSGKWENSTGGGASALNDLSDVNINSASDKEYLTYNNSTHKWENKDINSILSSTTRGAYCNFYTPVSANFLNCKVYMDLVTSSDNPTPSNPRFPTRYQSIAVGSCKNGSSYSYYLSGLFRTFGNETWYTNLGNFDWTYDSTNGVFKNEGNYLNDPKENFTCICSAAYVYKGSDMSVDKTIGYYELYPGTYNFWIRDNSFSGDAQAFKTHLSEVYAIYDTEDSNAISINNYNMLISKFNLESWAIKLTWADYGEYTYGGEWDVVNKTFYYTWSTKSNSDMSSGYTINNQYVTYDTNEWTYGLKVSGNSYCTHFTFESDTETPSVDCYSIHNNKIIFNIASLQSSWSDWLSNESFFKFHYETSNITSSSLSYSDIPSTYKIMNYMWSSADGSVEAQYYSGDATAYINFTNAVISSTELGNLDNVDISGVQNGEVLKYNSTSGKWENGADLNTPDYEDLSNKPMINGHVLIGNQSGEDLDLGGGGGGGGDISVKNFQVDNLNVNASYAKYFEIGSLVFVDCLFSITGSISSGAVMFSGLPSSAYQTYLIGASNNSSLNRFYTESGNIYSAMTLSSNAKTYHICGSYLKT